MKSIHFLCLWVEITLFRIIKGHHQELTIVCFLSSPQCIFPLFRFRISWLDVLVFFIFFCPGIECLVVEMIRILFWRNPVRCSRSFIMLIVLRINLFTESVKFISEKFGTFLILNWIFDFNNIEVLFSGFFMIFHQHLICFIQELSFI